MLALASVIAFSFVVTWLIAMAIEHTIGLRVSPEDEEHLDEVQQGMRAYDESPFALQQPEHGRAGPRSRSRRRAGQDLRLVSAVVDARLMDGSRLTDSLLSAGAQQIVSTDAHVYTASRGLAGRARRAAPAQGAPGPGSRSRRGPDRVAGVVASTARERRPAGRGVSCKRPKARTDDPPGSKA